MGSNSCSTRNLQRVGNTFGLQAVSLDMVPNGIPTMLKSESSSRQRGRENFGPQRCQGPTRFLRRAPFLDDRVDAFDHQDGDAAEEAKIQYFEAKPQMSLIKLKPY